MASSRFSTRFTHRRRSGGFTTGFSLTFLLDFYLPANILCAGRPNVATMAETLDMLSLLSRARSSCHRIAWRRGKPVSGAEFVTRARAWRSLLKHTPGRAFALYHDDAVEFAAALFGSWHGGKTIFLPGDNLAGTCASLYPSVDGYLGEFDSACAPRVPTAPNCAADVDGFDRIDPDFLGLVLYTSGTTGAAQTISKKLAQMAV